MATNPPPMHLTWHALPMCRSAITTHRDVTQGHGMVALSGAERAARYRARMKAGQKAVRYRRPADRRSAPARWADAVDALLGVLEGYQDWRDNLPAPLAESVTAERLDAVLELRELVEQLQT